MTDRELLREAFKYLKDISSFYGGHKSDKMDQLMLAIEIELADWDLLAATQASLREHMARVRELEAQRQWAGLTDADLMKEFGYTDELLRDTAYRVEQLLKGRNT